LNTNINQPYSVTKAAQIHLVKVLARVAAPEVRVNSVSPGILLTVSLHFLRISQPESFWGLTVRSKDWGKKFSQEKLDAAIQKSALKSLAEIDVIIPLSPPKYAPRRY